VAKWRGGIAAPRSVVIPAKRSAVRESNFGASPLQFSVGFPLDALTRWAGMTLAFS
jgi:hypothetical protein